MAEDSAAAATRFSFPLEEEKILQRWAEIDAFQTSLKQSAAENRPRFTFYDGPPFATGMPHYGHILAGTIKDTVTRYAHQTGHHVDRKWGWDCHGLPVEYEVEQALGIKGREGVLAMGIDKYNYECRSIVMRYSEAWKRVVTRLGRWIDMENDYRTMDPNFMESVWWVFKQLFEKGLVYRGFKVMPYSTACGTCLSNFEANLNYKDTSDPSVFVTFPIVGDEQVSLMAWTTTPWTLPSNLALCVNPDFVYSKITEKSSGKTYIVAECRLAHIFKTPDLYTVVSTCKGSELAGTRYIPLFNYFQEREQVGAFRVVLDTYVTDASGTGVVHQAPAFGEDDLRVCVHAGIVRKDEEPCCPIDANARFTDKVPEFAGQYIKDADKAILAHLKANGRLYQSGSIVHSYPFCWRSDTPLIYRTVPSWFVAVENIKERLLRANGTTRWVPEFVQTRRFQNWLEDARDWAISRDRFWGTPLPLWHSDDFEEIVCIGSIDELCSAAGIDRSVLKLAGNEAGILDLHRETIDKIEIPSKKGKGMLKRVEQVFDCWFESGSMPYAQVHYPFEDKTKFEQGFPADFIAEGLDQTRGWFYTLMVLSTALFDAPPFQNVIVNGLVLASDGKKMSKRLKNYPDPEIVISKHGSDALRLYLISSPAVRAEPLRFREEGVQQVVRDVLLPLYNTYLFFKQAAAKFEKSYGKPFASTGVNGFVASDNVMDQWIQASLSGLLSFVRTEMTSYRLYTVLPKIVQFTDNLSKWYVRMNRPRLKGKSDTEADAIGALSVLFEVLVSLSISLGPFTPFFADILYQGLRVHLPASQQQECVHYVMIPEPSKEAMDARMEEKVARMQALIDCGRTVRDRKALSLQSPLGCVTVVHTDPLYLQDITELSQYISEELNVIEVKTEIDDGSRVKLVPAAEMSLLGKRFGKDIKAIKEGIKTLSEATLRALLRDGSVEFMGHKFTSDEIKVTRELTTAPPPGTECDRFDDVFVIFDTTLTPSLHAMGTARSLISRVQKLRKHAGLFVDDVIEMFVGIDKEGGAGKEEKEETKGLAADVEKAGGEVLSVLSSRKQQIVDALGEGLVPLEFLPKYAVEIARETCLVRTSLGEVSVVLVLTRPQIHVKTENESIRLAASSLDYNSARATLTSGQTLTVSVDGSDVALVLNENAFLSVHAFVAAGNTSVSA